MRWGGRGARGPGAASGRPPPARADSRGSSVLLARHCLPRRRSRDKFGAPQTYRSVVIMLAGLVRRLVAVGAVWSLAGPLVAPAVPPPPLTVQTIWGTREFASDLVSIAWMKDGKASTMLDDAWVNTQLNRVADRAGQEHV